MFLDVRDLKAFYYRSALGRAAQRAVREQVQLYWPEAKGQTVVGFGFAVPLLRPYLGQARRVIGLMPGPQGVMPWPAGRPNVSALCEEALWPLDTGSVDKLVLMHGLETASNPEAVLAEVHRVLGPGGSVLFVVPNRAGLWSRSDATPFGFGRPYSPGQLDAQLKRHGFFIERHAAVLFQPPSNTRFWLKTGRMWEKVGRSTPIALAGGVLVVEASKQVPAPRRPSLGARVKKPLTVLEGLGLPEPSRRVQNRSMCGGGEE
ncbi:MAG: methyltransferase domain-containing protein [Maritimibacter sp.]